METIGFIGLGIMGRPMSANLVKAGFKVIGYEVVPDNAAKAAKGGVTLAGSVAEVAAQCPIIICMLPTPAICLDVALGKGGIAEHAKPGTLVLEMSSLSPMTIKGMHKGLAAKGIALVDAPVSGGEPKAIDGTLAVMVGGSQADFDRGLPVMQAMSASALRVGEIGAGCITKLANQIIVGVNIAGMCEGLALAAKAGVDPALVFEAIRGGLAGSAVMEAKAPMVLDRNYTPGGRIDIHVKDLVNVLNTAHSVAAPIPLATMVMEMMQTLRANGMGELDHGSLIRFYELVGNVEVKRGIGS